MTQNSNWSSHSLKIQTFFKGLPDTQKRILAGVLTVLVLVTSYVGIMYTTNENFRSSFLRRDNQSGTKVADSSEGDLSGAENILSNLNHEGLVFQQITLDQLELYHKGWVERHFNESERVNQLFAGANADADQDGLINRLEYMYGSNPRNRDTLCSGATDKPGCEGKNDKQNIDAGISPLTGQKIIPNRPIRITNQDQAVLRALETSIDNAAREGLDYPTLYQLSGTIDNTKLIEQVSITTVEDSRQSIMDYTTFQAEFLKELTSSDETANFQRVFVPTDAAALDSLAVEYQTKRDALKAVQVPSRFSSTHKGYVYIFERLIELTRTRAEGIRNNQLANKEYQTRLKDKAVEMIWGYRYIDSLENKS